MASFAVALVTWAYDAFRLGQALNTWPASPHRLQHLLALQSLVGCPFCKQFLQKLVLHLAATMPALPTDAAHSWLSCVEKEATIPSDGKVGGWVQETSFGVRSQGDFHLFSSRPETEIVYRLLSALSPLTSTYLDRRRHHIRHLGCRGSVHVEGDDLVPLCDGTVNMGSTFRAESGPLVFLLLAHRRRNFIHPVRLLKATSSQPHVLVVIRHHQSGQKLQNHSSQTEPV